MFYYYKHSNSLIVSKSEYPDLERITEDEARDHKGAVYLLTYIEPVRSRMSFCISHPSLAFLESEGLELLKKQANSGTILPDWMLSKIMSGRVSSINTAYPGWKKTLNSILPSKWRINISGLGDVGGMLVTGLRLLGGKNIASIGLYDIDQNKVKRWVFEAGQIYSPSYCDFPEIHELNQDEIFDCDMFIFCVSVGVPEIGSNVGDVRMAQLEGNSRIIRSYAVQARSSGFKGIFGVLSDPVDLLCKTVFLSSNDDGQGNLDFKGLYPEQIRGFGLGVMNARAAFYARKSPDTMHYLSEGRAFGPHGRGLVIADSIGSYNDELSLFLTGKAEKANIDIRSSGFKPYVAPALSSGVLSIMDAINGRWHYSSTFMGGVFMGARNKFSEAGTELETYSMPEKLWARLKNTYDYLGGII